MGKVRCADCGFLQLYRPYRKPEPFITPPHAVRVPNGNFRCWRDVQDFDGRAIDRERDCVEFIAYEPGHTAKDHWDMREIRQTQRWDRRIMVAIALASIGGVVIGLLNLLAA